LSSELAFPIRALTPADLESYRDIRLEGLRLSPEAFGSSYEEEVARPAAEFVRRLSQSPGAMFGAFAASATGAANLIATAGCYVEDGIKSRHKLHLVGMYVRPAYRQKGLARRLVERVLDHARAIEGIAVVQLGVACDNQAARTLYDRLGFKVYGVEPKALKIGERFLDEELRVFEI
jgi:ribosomal protein S18 acetylase RimI-like enzyme